MGAIPENLWPEIRRSIKGFFQLPNVWANRPVDCPSTEALDILHYRALRGWRKRWVRPLSKPIDRLNPNFASLRNAQKTNEFWRPEPDNLADGLDFIPAPLAQVKPYGDRKTDADDVDFRAGLCPWDD